MGRLLTTFAVRSESEKARTALDAMGLPYEVVSPDPGYAQVGVPSLALDQEARFALASRLPELMCSGWVDYRPASNPVPDKAPPEFKEDIFGNAAIVVLASCTADERKIRIVAHISGDLAGVFPYLNAEMKHACYNPNGPTFTFMDGYRMVSAYPHRIAVAKADEIVDAWRVLESLRQRANMAWARRSETAPSYERREKPPALEIYKRLPGTNCGQCGEQSCLAFAVQVHMGHAEIAACKPAMEGEFSHLRDALVEICAGLGVGQ